VRRLCDTGDLSIFVTGGSSWLRCSSLFALDIPLSLVSLGLVMGEVTRILEALGRGETKAADELLPLVYDELRQVAARQMAHETPTQTLQPTALVHEAWLRLAGNGNPNFANRAHFFTAAAEAMRRILIETARRKRAVRHGAGLRALDIEDISVAAPAKDDELLAVDEVLEKFAAEDRQKAELVKLRYFVGFTLEESAEILGISAATAKRWWTYARAWLFKEISGEEAT
jgi:RNA polymerase sigma factor (TIGR02999 family)